VPLRGSSRSRSSGRPNISGRSGSGMLKRRRTDDSPRVVASMFTTVGFRRSATSAKDTAPGGTGATCASGPTGAAGMTGLSGDGLANPDALPVVREPVVADAAADAAVDPATLKPTRKETNAVRQTVTIR